MEEVGPQDEAPVAEQPAAEVVSDDDGAVEREEDVGGEDEADDDVGEGVA